jgi:hypothetical protein
MSNDIDALVWRHPAPHGAVPLVPTSPTVTVQVSCAGASPLEVELYAAQATIERLTRERDEAVAQCDYSAEDMRTYAAAAIEQAVARERERCAWICDPFNPDSPDSREECAAAIRRSRR